MKHIVQSRFHSLHHAVVFFFFFFCQNSNHVHWSTWIPSLAKIMIYWLNLTGLTGVRPKKVTGNLGADKSLLTYVCMRSKQAGAASSSGSFLPTEQSLSWEHLPTKANSIWIWLSAWQDGGRCQHLKILMWIASKYSDLKKTYKLLWPICT